MNRLIVVAVVLVVAVAGCAHNRTRGLAALASSSHITDMRPVEIAAKALSDRYGTDRVLVVYDIDNTLLAMTTLLGSDQWFDHQFKVAPPNQRIYKSPDCLFKSQGLLYLLRPMRATDASVSEVIAALRQTGVRQWVLTSRSPTDAAATLRELRRQHFRFSQFDHSFELPSDPFPAYDTAERDRLFTPEQISEWELKPTGKPAYLVDGIYFTTGQHKGAMLRLLIERLKLGRRVKGIVFVDDRRRHVLAMESAFQGSNVELFAYEYDAERKAVDAYDASATLQAEAMADWCGLVPLLPALGKALNPDVYDVRNLEQCNAAVCP